MISRYMHDPGKSHWEAVRWILQYIKSTVNDRLVFEKDGHGKQECKGYMTQIMLGILTSVDQLQGMFFTLS